MKEARLRFDNINILRALAALCVIVYHVIEHTHWTGFPVSGPLLVLRVGWVGVDLFFVISGFVIAHSAFALFSDNAADFQRRYWMRRLARIVPLYLATLVLWLAVFGRTFFLQPPSGWLWQIVSHLTFIHCWSPTTHGAIDGPNWSVAVEMQFYALVALALPWLLRARPSLIVGFGIAAAWAWRSAVFGALDPAPSFDMFVYTTQLPGRLDEFGLGIALARMVAMRPPGSAAAANAAAICGAVLAAAGVAAWLIYWANAIYWNNAWMVICWRSLLGLAMAGLVGLVVYLPSAPVQSWLRPLDDLGTISYGLYLWHLFVIRLLVDDIPSMTPVQVLAVTMGVTVALATLSWRYLEEPALKLGRELEKRWVATAAPGSG